MKAIQTKRLERYITWQYAHAIMAICVIVTALISALAFAWPVRNTIRITDTSPETASKDVNDFGEWLQSQGLCSSASFTPIRSGLFKSASRLRRAPEDKTVERIKSQLKLRSLTSLKGVPIAFVTVEGEGMRPFRIGETIVDSVKVLDIDLQQNQVEIEVAGTKTTLNHK